MTFRFQRMIGQDQWADVATAEGHGANPASDAIDRLITARNGDLSPGEYRYRPIDGHTHEWATLLVSSP